MKQHTFDKFINTEKNSKKKEAFKQVKRKEKDEKKQYFEEKNKAKVEHHQRFAGTNEKPMFQDKRSKPQPVITRDDAIIKRKPEAQITQHNTQDTRHKTQDSRFKIQDTRHKTQDSRFKTQESRFKTQESRFKTQDSRFKTQESRFKNQDSRIKTQDTRFKTSNQQSRKTGTGSATSDMQPATEMPLNKFIAYAGICGRREAAILVKEGKIKVNNDLVYEPGFKVSSTDKIVFNGKQLHVQKNLVYILLNKPKDYITTAKDTHNRKTIFDLINHATTERVYSVGRLDRNTTGVLLLTNDGELTQKLTHPSFEVKKIYEVKLDKPLAKKDMEAIADGIELEDGFITADTVGYADPKDKSVIGIEIHSGRNRIVRRIFEHLGYDVKNLDRVLFANLTKKNVDRGKWRFLNEKEIRLLKYMNQSFTKKKTESTTTTKIKDQQGD